MYSTHPSTHSTPHHTHQIPHSPLHPPHHTLHTTLHTPHTTLHLHPPPPPRQVPSPWLYCIFNIYANLPSLGNCAEPQYRAAENIESRLCIVRGAGKCPSVIVGKMSLSNCWWMSLSNCWWMSLSNCWCVQCEDNTNTAVTKPFVGHYYSSTVR